MSLILGAIFTLLLSTLKSVSVPFIFVFLLIISGTEIPNFDKYSVTILIFLGGKEKYFRK